MNIRQLKKQYKRKHGFNPPKGYSRAQIRKGIKQYCWQNAIEVCGYEFARGLAEGLMTINEAVRKILAHQNI